MSSFMLVYSRLVSFSIFAEERLGSPPNFLPSISDSRLVSVRDQLNVNSANRSCTPDFARGIRYWEIDLELMHDACVAWRGRDSYASGCLYTERCLLPRRSHPGS